jgi:hypothetical protein
MTPTKLKTSRPPQAEESLGAVLSRAHKVWIKETRRFLLPATLASAPFWDRWTAVRYLADQFLGQYRRERALVDELRPFLAPRVMERLCRDGERIGELRLELDALGRRRGTALKVAAASQGLLEVLQRWCTEIESAASRLPKSVVPEEATRLIAQLETFEQLHA